MLEKHGSTKWNVSSREQGVVVRLDSLDFVERVESSQVEFGPIALLSNPDFKLICFLLLSANYSTYLFRQRLCSLLTAL